MQTWVAWECPWACLMVWASMLRKWVQQPMRNSRELTGEEKKPGPRSTISLSPVGRGLQRFLKGLLTSVDARGASRACRDAKDRLS